MKQNVNGRFYGPIIIKRLFGAVSKKPLLSIKSPEDLWIILHIEYRPIFTSTDKLIKSFSRA